MRKIVLLITFFSALVLSCQVVFHPEIKISELLKFAEAGKGAVNAEVSIELSSDEAFAAKSKDITAILKDYFVEVKNVRKEGTGDTASYRADISIAIVEKGKQKNELIAFLCEKSADSLRLYLYMNARRFAELETVTQNKLGQKITAQDCLIDGVLINDSRRAQSVQLTAVYVDAQPSPFAVSKMLAPKARLALRMSDILRDYSLLSDEALFLVLVNNSVKSGSGK